MDKTEEAFKTYKICFTNRDDFNKALKVRNLADDIGHSDMILTYQNKYIRGKFAGWLRWLSIDGFYTEPL